jgi:chemotaxis regulatin CheY-phosphate phosphatase CheZ
VLHGPVVDAAGRTDVVSNQGEGDLLASLGFYEGALLASLGF